MAISFIDSVGVAADINATSFSVTAPTGIQDDDLLVFVCAIDHATNPTVTFTGWTLMHAEDSGRNRAYYKIAASEGASWTFTTSGTMAAYAYGVSCYRGVNTATPFIGEGETTQATSLTVTPPTVNNTDAAAWWVGMAGEWRGGSGTINASAKSWTCSAGTEREDIDANITTTDNPSITLWDSNGVIATGNTSITFTESTPDTTTITGWMGVINPISDVTNTNQLMMMGVGT